MSTFPDAKNFSRKNSLSQLSKLSGLNRNFENEVLLKREKGAYLYDLDENKYVDFFLNHGKVILGHTQKTWTTFVKNAISYGVTASHPNKFIPRILTQLESLTDFSSYALFSSEFEGLYRIFQMLDPKTVLVNTSYGFEVAKQFIDEEEISTDKKSNADLALLEPVDFDGNLSDVDFSKVDARVKISLESRSNFRFGAGFLKSLSQCDGIFSSGSLSGGMDSSVFLSNQIRIPSGNLPPFQAVALNESLKLLKRKSHFLNAADFIPKKLLAASRGSVFKLKNPPDEAKLLSQGIYSKGDLLFLSSAHSEHDLLRLKRSL